MDLSQPIFLGQRGEDIKTYVSICEYRILNKVPEEYKEELFAIIILSGLKDVALNFTLKLTRSTYQNRILLS